MVEDVEVKGRVLIIIASFSLDKINGPRKPAY